VRVYCTVNQNNRNCESVSCVGLYKAVHTLSFYYAYCSALPLLATHELYVCTPQQFDPVIAALLEGQPVGLSAMQPFPPDSVASSSMSVGQKEDDKKQQASEDIPALSNVEASSELAVAASSDEPEVDIYSSPPAPVTVMDASEQRLSKYAVLKATPAKPATSVVSRSSMRIPSSYVVQENQ
jgi:hypothetical protein